MATITLTISSAAVTRFVTAIGYSATLPNGQPNPVTALQAGKDWLINDIKSAIRAYESPGITAAALTSNSLDIENNVLIT